MRKVFSIHIWKSGPRIIKEWKEVAKGVIILVGRSETPEEYKARRKDMVTISFLGKLFTLKLRRSVRETVKRSFVKTASCKAIEIFVAGLLMHLLFHQAIMTVGVPLLIEGAQTAIFVGHERMWARIEWGNHNCADCPHGRE